MKTIITDHTGDETEVSTDLGFVLIKVQDQSLVGADMDDWRLAYARGVYTREQATELRNALTAAILNLTQEV